jgi:hypothetical protein
VVPLDKEDDVYAEAYNIDIEKHIFLIIFVKNHLQGQVLMTTRDECKSSTN